MGIVQINTAFNVGLDFEVAPFHRRLLAYLIDFAVLFIYLFSILYLLDEYGDLDYESRQVYRIFLLCIPMFLYSLITETLMNGQTIGKKLLKIRVISLEGGEPSFGQFVIRSISKIFEWPLMFFPGLMGYTGIWQNTLTTAFAGIVVVVVILVTKKNQRLGDLMAGTAVVDAKTYLSVRDTIFMNVDADNYKVMFPEVMRLSDNDINTVKTVLTRAAKTHNYDICMRVDYKIKEVLKISSKLSAVDFLEKLMEDYNYLATRE